MNDVYEWDGGAFKLSSVCFFDCTPETKNLIKTDMTGISATKIERVEFWLDCGATVKFYKGNEPENYQKSIDAFRKYLEMRRKGLCR